MDSESIGGACWSAPLSPGHTWDEQPCPWIRYFWNLAAVERTALDRIIPMDTYTTNSSEFPFDLWLYQKYFSVDRIGFGLYPTTGAPNARPPASDAFVASRLGAFDAYDADWISVWVINPGSSECPTWACVEKYWAPWIGPFREFLSS